MPDEPTLMQEISRQNTELIILIFEEFYGLISNTRFSAIRNLPVKHLLANALLKAVIVLCIMAHRFDYFEWCSLSAHAARQILLALPQKYSKGLGKIMLLPIGLRTPRYFALQPSNVNVNDSI